MFDSEDVLNNILRLFYKRDISRLATYVLKYKVTTSWLQNVKSYCSAHGREHTVIWALGPSMCCTHHATVLAMLMVHCAIAIEHISRHSSVN